MQTPYLFALRLILGLSDFIFINICFFVGFYLSDKYQSRIDATIFYDNIFTSSLVWFLTTNIFKLYSKRTIYNLGYVSRATWKSVALHGFIFLPYMFLMYHVNFPKSFMLAFYLLMVIGFLVSRLTSKRFEEIIKRKFETPKAVAILGMNKGGLKLAAYLERQSNFDFKGFLGDENYYVDENGKLKPAVAEQIKAAANSHISDVFVCLPAGKIGDIRDLLKEAEKHCVRLKFVPDFDYTGAPFFVGHTDEFAILNRNKGSLKDMGTVLKTDF